MIRNTDQRSKDYGEIAAKFRPGHADITYHLKYGLRDYRGGGRSSARETAARVAAGGVARAVLAALAPTVRVRGALVQIGDRPIDRAAWDWDEVPRNPFWSPDAAAAEGWAGYLDGLRKSGNSVGAVVEVVAEGVPPGLGAPVYAKLDSDLAMALMTINAVKGVEIGAGFAAAALTGVENADEIFMGNDGPALLLEPRRRHPRRHLDRPGRRRPLRGQADLLDPDAAPHDHRRPARRPRSSPRAATTPASASAPCRSARRCSPACSSTTCCCTAARSATPAAVSADPPRFEPAPSLLRPNSGDRDDRGTGNGVIGYGEFSDRG